MPYKGHVENGVVILDEPVSLDDGTEVQVEVTDKAPSPDEDTGLSLTQRLAGVVGKAQSLPEDAAEHHDHYLYGVPKQ